MRVLDRLARRRPRDYQISVGILGAIGAAFGSAALGLVPDIAVDLTDGDPFAPARVWLAGAFVLLMFLFLFAAAVLWRARTLWLRGHGTAYVVRETAEGWHDDNYQAFLAAMRGLFNPVREVPGPRLESGPWPSSPSRPGAALGWDNRVDQVVRAFRVVHETDDRSTPDSLFLTLPGSAAVCLGDRLYRDIRNLRLNVWQRPSSGRGPQVTIADALAGDPHDPSEPAVSATFAFRKTHEAAVRLVVDGSPPAEADASQDAEADPAVDVVVVRATPGKWGPVPRAGLLDGVGPDLDVVNGSGAELRPGRARIRCFDLTRSGSSGPASELGWAEFPAVTAATTDCLVGALQDTKSDTVLLAVTGPNEVQFMVGAALRLRPGGAEFRRTWLTHWDREQEVVVVDDLVLGG